MTSETALAARGAKLYSDILRAYDFEDAASLAILRSLAECVDLIDECRARIAADGLMVPGAQGQPVRHPLLQTEADARRSLLAHARALRLDLAAEEI